MANRDIILYVKTNATQTSRALATLSNNVGKVGRQLDIVRTKSNMLSNDMVRGFQRVKASADVIDGEWREVGTKGPSAFQKVTQSAQRFAATLGNVAARLRQITVGLASGGAGGLGGGIGNIGNMFSSMGSRINRTFSGVARAIDNLRGHFMNLNDYLRFTTQAITNTGRALMFFISIPVAAALGKAIMGAVEYEDALVRVKKTTGLTGDELDKLSNRIRFLAKNTKSSHVELASMAEIVGQMGVTSVGGIINMVQIIELLTTATKMTAEETATSLGRIANAFKWNLNESTKEVYKFANVINYLENTTASSAGEIITAVYKSVQSAALLDVAAADVAAFAATLISAGFTAEEAGTSLRNSLVYMVRNADAVVTAMEGHEKYADATKVMNEINKDAVGVLMDVVKAAEQGESNAKSLLLLMEIGSLRGGRGLAALASNVAELEENLGNARNEWSETTSLAYEYEEALKSTKAQMQMFTNNVNDAAIMIGDTLLPIINNLIQVAVPAIRRLAQAFKDLNPQVQHQIILWTAVGLLAGPVIMFFGQILHAITLVNLGLGQLTRVFVSLIGGFGRVAGAIVGFGKYLVSVPGLIVAALVGILVILQKIGVDVAGFFANLATAAQQWGEKLMASMSSGILAGAVRYIVAAITWVANLIASFFRGLSPPKEGPLKDIDKWGAKVFTSYLKGFRNADFSVLREVGQMIERVLTRGLEGKSLAAALQQVAKARALFARLVKEFNSTGKINERILDQVTRGMGEQTKYMKEMIRLQLRYNQLKERLAELEQKRKAVIASYKNEIAAIGASNMSIEDKIASIRQSQRMRDGNLDAIDAEKEGLEEESALLKEQYEWHKNMLDAMNDQADIFQRILDALEAAKEAAKGAGAGEMGGFGIDTSGADEAKSALEEASQAMEAFIDRFENGKLALQGFFDALAGKPKAPLMDEKYQKYARNLEMGSDTKFVDTNTLNLYNTMYKLGEQAAEVRDKIQGIRDGVTGFIDDIKRGFDDVVGAFSLDKLGEFDIKGWFAGIVEDFTELPLIQAFKAGWDSINIDYSVLIDGWNQLVDAVKELWAALSELAADPGVQKTLSGIGAVISWLLGLILKLGTWFIVTVIDIVLAVVTGFVKVETAFVKLGLKINQVIWSIINWFRDLPNKIADTKQKIIDWWEGLKTSIKEKINSIVSGAGEWFAGIGDSISSAMDRIKTVLLEKMEAVLEFFGITEEIKEKWRKIFDDMRLIAAKIWDNIRTAVIDAWNQLVAELTEVFGPVVETLTEVWNSIKETVIQIATDIVTGVVGILTTIWESIVTAWTEAIADITAAWNEIKAAIEEVAQSIWQAVSEKFMEIAGIIATTISDVVEDITALATDAYTAAVAFIQGFLDGVSEKAGEVVTLITDTVQGWIDAVKEKLGIASPSSVLLEIAKDTIQGFIDGIVSMAEKGIESVETFIGDIIAWLQTPANVFDKFLSIGASIIEGILEGLTNAWGEITAWFSEKLQEMPDWVKALLGIASPSQVFAEIGNQIMQGLLVGLVDSDAATAILRAVEETIARLQAALNDLVVWLNGPFLEQIFTFGGNIITFMIEGMVNKLPELEEFWMGRIIPMFIVFYRLLMKKVAPAVHKVTQEMRGLQNAVKNFGAESNVAAAFSELIDYGLIALGIMEALVDALNNLHSKTIIVTVKYKSKGEAPEGYASGGYWDGRSPILVGERGVELLFPGAGGTIVPNSQVVSALSSMGDRPSKQTTININNPVVRRDDDLQAIRDMIEDVLNEESEFAINFGGAPTF